MRIKTVFIMIGIMLFSPNIARESCAAEKVEMANPASVFCVESGYTLEIRTNPHGGQYGVCIFPDKKECEEWAFFRNECGKEYRKPSVLQPEKASTPSMTKSR